jgi:diacylglycerol kinase family enzyme
MTESLAAAKGAAIAVFVNPQSRANRRHPELAAEFQAVVSDIGRVYAPQTLAELDGIAAALHAAPPGVIAIHGGDGTLHRTVTALGRAWGDDQLPPLAILCGGTMNVVAASLGIAGPPLRVLRAIADATRAGRPLPTMRRRCLRVGDRLGFVFGNGLMANFLGEYYGGKAGYGPSRALWLIVRTFFSTLVRGPFARRIFRRFHGEVRVDGVPLQRTRFVGVGAATVREVGLGFKLNHRADDDPERFGVLAIHAPPLALVADLASVHSGRGIAASRAFSAVASELVVTPQGRLGDGDPRARPGTSGDMSYTIDGDLYTTSEPVRITVGPPVWFVQVDASRPTAQLMTAGPEGDGARPAKRLDSQASAEPPPDAQQPTN